MIGYFLFGENLPVILFCFYNFIITKIIIGVLILHYTIENKNKIYFIITNIEYIKKIIYLYKIFKIFALFQFNID